MERYLGPSGWSTDPRGAEIMLRVSAGKNEFFIAKDGQWIQGEDSLRERALSWVLRPSRGGIRFTGLLAVDKPMETTLLENIEFETISDTEFLIPSEEDAREFAKRVRTAGGDLRKGSPLPEMPQANRKEATLAEDQNERIAKLTDLDARTLRAVERGDRSGVPDFEARGPEIRKIIEESRKSNGPEFENELIVRAGAEERMRVLLGQAAPGESAALPSMLQQLALLWKENGVDATWAGKEVEINIPEGTIYLGQQIRFTSEEEN